MVDLIPLPPAMGSFMIYFTYLENHGPITEGKLRSIILSFLSLSLVQNIAISRTLLGYIYSSSLLILLRPPVAIAFRLLFLQRTMKHEMHTSTLSRVRRAIIIIIESGAIYSCSMAIFVGAFATSNVTVYGWSGVVSILQPTLTLKIS
jgi:hypothetical protein